MMRQPLARDRHRQMFVRRVLRAAGIGMRHPDRAQAQHVGEDVVRQRAAQIGQDRRLLAGGARQIDAAAHATHGSSGSRRVAVNMSSRPLASFTIGKPWRSRWRRSAGSRLVRHRPRPRSAAGTRAQARRRHRVDRASPGLPTFMASTSKRAPAEHLLGGRQAGLAPARIDGRAVGSAVDLAIGERASHRGRDLAAAPIPGCGSGRSAR